VLTDAKNNGTQGFRQIRASLQNPTSYLYRCIMIAWDETSSTPPFTD
jgi:hypothetical protein